MSEKSDEKTDGKQDEKKVEDTRDLAYYLAHPTEMPTDPNVLNDLVVAQAEADAAVASAATSAVTKEDKPAQAAAGAAQPSDTGAPTEIAGVLTKDGKHFLPYAELERRVDEERSRTGAAEVAKQAAEQYANDLQRQLEEANAQRAALERGERPADAKAAAEVPKELMDRIREEFPSFAALFDAQQAALTAVGSEVEELRKSVRGEQNVRARTEAEEVQELIDTVPELKAWQAGSATQKLLFSRATQVEQALMQGKFAEAPEMKGQDLAALLKDDAKRYGIVVSIVKREVGLPASSTPSTKDDKKTLSEKADATVAAAAQSPVTPRSLSDLSAGEPVAQSEVETLEAADPAVLGQRFMKMTEEQRAAYLSRL